MRTLQIVPWLMVTATAALYGCGGEKVDPARGDLSKLEAAQESLSLSVQFPSGQTPDDTLLAATDQLVILDGVSVGEGNELESVASFGANTTEIGSRAQLRANLRSEAPVSLRASAHVFGFVQTGATITTQNDVVIDGERLENQTIEPATFEWQEAMPSASQGDVVVDPDQERALEPGAYGRVSVRSRAVITLSSGTYFFDSLVTEPQGLLRIDDANGPVRIYVRSELSYRGAIQPGAAPGELLIGYLGASPAFIEAPFTGTLVAPNAQIQLRRPNDNSSHRGAFFGKSIEIQSDALIVHLPFTWESLIAFVDEDCDGMNDALEQAAGLNPADPSDALSDADNDGIPAEDELRVGGNPASDDSDGDGAPDDADLLTGRDFDGDGAPFESDNCPDDTNQEQLDQDADGVGDACDDTPLGGDLLRATVTLQVARHATTRRFGVLDAESRDSTRQNGDQRGLLPTGTSFRLFMDAFDGSVMLTEHFKADSGAHAYAVNTAERRLLAAAGFRELGVLGHASSVPLTFGESTAVERFSKGQDASREDALTSDPAEAAALAASGFTALGPVGFGLADYGQLSNGWNVIRYRSSAAQSLHSTARSGDVPLDGFVSEGPQFQLLPEKNGWTQPVYRLRNASGAEALSTGADDLAELQAGGFVLEGVLGHVYAQGRADSFEHVTRLIRLRSGDTFAYAATAQAIAELEAEGFSPDVVLGSAIRVPATRRSGSQCTGQSDPFTRISAGLGPEIDPVYANVGGLYALNAACTLQRLANGQVVSEEEQRIAPVFEQVDPETRRQLGLTVAEVLATTAERRSQALGPLASLDPGACSSPIDYTSTASSIGTITLGLEGSPDVPNGGSTGGATPESHARLRAAQCAGVIYDPALATTPGAAERAISARDDHQILRRRRELDILVDVSQLEPALYGIKPDPASSPVAQLNAYAERHEPVGLPLIGMDVGPCSDACTEAAGQICIADRCRAYPIVPKGSAVQLTGSNFWDIKTAELRLTDFETGIRLSDQGVQIDILPPQGEDLAERCDPTPVFYDPFLSGPIACPPDAPDCIELDDYVPTPEERWLEKAHASIRVDAGKFYQVQLVNNNGSYFRFGDRVAVTPDTIADLGRTVHVCAAPNCEPPPDPDAAACTLTDVPACGGAAGGIWNTPPRPLAHCVELDTACPETPLEFVSAAALDDVPMLIFVGDPTETKFIQTRLVGLQCFDETGWDAMGKDELVVNVASNPLDLTPLEPGDIADLESAFGTFTTNINSGNRRTNDILMSSTATQLFNPVRSPFLLQWGEDDDIGWEHLALGALAAAGAAGGAAAAGGAGLAIGLAAGGTGGSAFVTAVLLELPDPDDFLGRAAYQADADDITARGQLSHDGVLGPIESLPLIESSNRDVSGLLVAEHPAVDLQTFDTNEQAADQSCTATSACSAGRECVVGACVPVGWVDRSLPLGFDPAQDLAGTIERRDYRGSGAHYRGFVSTSLSGKDLKGNP